MLSGGDWWISIRSTKTVVNVSLESSVHKALKDEQIECIHRIVCHGRYVLAVLPTGLGKSATYQLISKVLYRTTNATSKTIAELLVSVGLQSGTVPSPSSASKTYSLRTHYALPPGQSNRSNPCPMPSLPRPPPLLMFLG